MEKLNRYCMKFTSRSGLMALPQLPPPAGQAWRNVFYDDFTGESYTLDTNFRHMMGKQKWKWDARSNKEIWWDPAGTRVVTDTSSGKPILRVSVWSDWFHRIDRLESRQQFGYGYYESRLRFKGAEGMHSAFWLLPKAMTDNPVAPGEIKGGVEIDVVENRKVDGSGADIHSQGNTAVHWGGYGANHRSVAFKMIALPAGPATWATFGVFHFEGGMKWYWNGKEVNSVRVWSPMKNSILFSTEVNESGGWAGNDLESYGSVENPAGYIEVDYTGFWEQVVGCQDVADACEDVTNSVLADEFGAEATSGCADHVVEDALTDSSSNFSVAGATRCVDHVGEDVTDSSSDLAVSGFRESLAGAGSGCADHVVKGALTDSSSDSVAGATRCVGHVGEVVTGSSSDLALSGTRESVAGTTRFYEYVVEEVTDSSSDILVVSEHEFVAGATRCVDVDVADL